MKLKDVDVNKPVFTHVDMKTGECITLAAQELADWCKRTNQPIQIIPIEKQYSEFNRENRGVEEHRFKKFELDGGVKEPMVFCTWPDGTHLLVDGTHRYVWLAEHNAHFGAAYILDEKDWRPFVIEDYPTLSAAQVRKLTSGIKE